MNNSIEFAQESTGKVTVKAMLDVMRKATSSCSLHGRMHAARQTWQTSFIFELRATSKKNGAETTTILDVPGDVTNGHTDEKDGVHKPTRVFWYLFAKEQAILDVLEILPKDAEVAFMVGQDHYTTEGLRLSGFHADVLYLYASYTKHGKRVTRSYIIDVHTGGHNSARPGKVD